MNAPQHVCPPDHGHAATTTCYTQHKCRCFPCRLDNAKRTALCNREPQSLPPEPVAAHVAHLRAFGYTYRQIALAAGINERTPYMLAHGRLKFVHARVGRALLAVKPTIAHLDPGTIIPSRGLRRRVQALGTLGWTLITIAPHAGTTRERLSQSYGSEHITVRTHLQVAEAYERLWNTQPPAPDFYAGRTILRTRRKARSKGWVPPLGWDDIDNDPEPPQAEPDEDSIDTIAVDLAVSEGARVQLSIPDRRAAVRQLSAIRRLPDTVIARMLLVDAKTIANDRAAMHLPAAVGHDGMSVGRTDAA